MAVQVDRSFIYLILLLHIIFSKGDGQRIEDLAERMDRQRNRMERPSPVQRNAEPSDDGKQQFNRQPSNFQDRVQNGAERVDRAQQQPQQQQRQAVEQPAKPIPVTALKLSKSQECANDVRRLCKGQDPHNFAVLQCFHELKDDSEISDDCQNMVWQYRNELTKDKRFETATTSVCKGAIQNITECNKLQEGEGLMIPCLIYYMDSINNEGCREFLSRMESIVFSDYQFIYKFADACKKDIDDLACGRSGNAGDSKNKLKLHDQGKTVSCLAEHAAKLQPKCQHELLRLAELQADDYHKDRQLYFACREDRELLCPKVVPGGGNVYKCLYRHKFDTRMSEACREKLTVRQKLQQKNYRVNRGIAVACKQDILANDDCQQELSDHRDVKMAGMSALLTCLETVQLKGKSLRPECVAELKEVRHSLLEDYKISPEIVHKCDDSIKNYCNGVRQHTIHCLMDLARPKLSVNDGRKVTDECYKELVKLMKQTAIGEDYSVDPAVQEDCDVVVKSHCQGVQPGEGRVYACLMTVVNRPNIMTPACKERLMEVRYFLTRDFSLTTRFYRRCSEDLNKCTVTDMTAEGRANVLFCLFNKMKENKDISDGCSSELKVLLIERAKSVDLEPEIEDACRNDLANFCSMKTKKNEEMDCLEDNFERLERDCKSVVTKYIDRVEDMPEVDGVLADACESFWKENCKDALQGDKSAESLLKCLIEKKNDEDMPPKCRAGVEHHQLITLKDFTLSHAFRDACKEDVGRLCSDARTKATVIACLSLHVRNNTIFDQQQKVSPLCRKQLTFELLQRSEDIVLDPDLKEACEQDVDNFCKNVKPGRSMVIDCLRGVQKRLSKKCHELIFKREEEEAEDPTTDFKLMTKCKKMIKKYCMDDMSSPETIFSCLVKHKEAEENFDERCSRVLVQRMRVRAHDIRLNPDLMKDCKKDIEMHCKHELDDVMREPKEAEGKVMFCLRRYFAMKQLTPTCTDHVAEVVKESVLDHVQDTRLVEACSKEIKELCSDAAEAEKNDEMGDKGQVEQCLKKNLLLQRNTNNLNRNCLQELVRIMAENKADVHLDPVLFRACSLDLKGYCKDVYRGEGRQMSCLISALDDSKYKLQKGCETQLRQRIELWSAAVQVAPPDNFRDLLSQVYESEARSYLLAVMIGVIACIFVFGLLCGRVTKRVARQLKDK